MANNPVVLLIHGMGTHSDESIKAEFKVGLEKCMEFFGHENFDVNDKFSLKTFNYSEYWDEKRKAFADHLNGEIKESLSLTPKLVQRLLDVTAEFDGDDFLHTHLLDVLFYLTGALRSHQLVKLHATLAKEIEENINDLNSGPLIVVAHSLGTAFIHDCLTQLYSSRLDPAAFGLDQLWSIATVSRLTHLLSGMDDPMTSIVTDHSSTTHGVCQSFYPVYNKYDPFCWFKRLDRNPNSGVLLETQHVRDLKTVYGNHESLRINPHDLREYFADPSVGGRFLALNKVINININDLTAAQARYNKTAISNTDSNVLEKVKTEMKKLGEEALTVFGNKKKMEILAKVYELIDEMRDEFKTFEGDLK